jgi:predicted HD superfamily hydrolase involved in NAD metabolism
LIQTTTPILDLDQAKAWLKGILSPERFEHSLGAHEKAADLAEKFHLPDEERERAAIAGLLHDAAKLMNSRALLDACERYGLALESIDRETPQTLHPFVGAELVRETFQLSDPDILNAIRYHTTGRSGMSQVEKIVYIADKIEGNTRNPLYIQHLTASLDYRRLWTLDLTMLFILDSSIRFLIDKHHLIHPRTVEARNDFINRLRAGNHLP